MKRIITTVLATMVACYGYSQTDYLPLTGGTLTGTLTGTSANLNAYNQALRLDLANDPDFTWIKFTTSSNANHYGSIVNGATGIQIKATSIAPDIFLTPYGAGKVTTGSLTGTSATFSGALTTNGHLTTGTGGVYVGSAGQSWIWPRGTNDIAIGADNDDRLYISGTSAAFSVPLTTSGYLTTGTGGVYIGTPGQSWIWPRGTNDIALGADNDDRLYISGTSATFSVPLTGTSADFSSNVGIGTTQTTANLYVHGIVKSKEVKVEATVTVPDYVFEKSYDLKSLSEVEKYITQNKHLPEIPSAKLIEKEGINVGEMQLGLLKKIEELTLYMIDINKTVTNLKQENIALKKEIVEMKSTK